MSQLNQDDPSSSTRLALALLLSFIVIFGYSYFFNQRYSSGPAENTAVETVETPVPGQALTSDTLPAKKHFETLPEEKEVVLENPLVKVTFTSYRGAVKSAVLKMAGLIRDAEVPLISYQNPDVQPGALQRIGEISSQKLLSYEVKEKGPDFVVFEAQEADLTVQKKFTLLENYAVELVITFINGSDQPLKLNGGYDLSVGYFKAQHLEEELRPVEFDAYVSGGEGAYLQKAIGKIENRLVEDLHVSWAGLKTKYFALLAKPADASSEALISDAVEENFELYYASALRMNVAEIAPKQQVQSKFLLYGGPKDYNLLKSFGFHFESLMDFGGIWGSLSRGLVLGLRGIYKIFHNYGVAIIVLTILIKLLFYPLSAISLKSMKQMQLLRPEMEEIKKKYKDNPKKVQQATMDLYRKNNVKPLAGCLPMLVQIPIFIAFYKVLTVSIELRGANFLWIQDLARADTIFHVGGFPLNILPILNGLTMFWQQSLTPTDPNQKALKYMMPIMITVFFYNLPSGLILYWLITTLVTVLQQYQVQKTSSTVVVS
jgi:YidC/Oxa1 family membrane protein insertase